jgi:hypothetical protein
MKLSWEQDFGAAPGRVFAALLDPGTLKSAIEGCEKLERLAENRYDVVLKLGLAGLKGTYSGNVEVRDARPPEELTIAFEGKGPGGFVRGSARARLAARAEGTRLSAEGEATVGGVLAAVGSRLIEAAARKVVGDFFRRLAGMVK